MYHEITYAQERRRLVKRVVITVIIVAVAAAIAYAAMVAMAQAREQAVVSVRDSVLNAAKQCCSVEGSYPASLEYLERNYGLVINHEDYTVSYEWFADNVLPSVVVSAL
ncbi:MAG: hypothetical protein IJ087_03170 [Eggerthellaceae bacterium]|nr:hypothetical protein [Eggerthellaceae bacterium]